MIHFVFYYRKMDILKKLFISRLSPVRRWDSAVSLWLFFQTIIFKVIRQTNFLLDNFNLQFANCLRR